MEKSRAVAMEFVLTLRIPRPAFGKASLQMTMGNYLLETLNYYINSDSMDLLIVSLLAGYIIRK